MKPNDPGHLCHLDDCRLFRISPLRVEQEPRTFSMVLLSLMLICEISWLSIAGLSSEPLAPGVQSLVFFLSIAGGNSRFIFPLILAALIFDVKATDHSRFQWRALLAVPGAYIVLWYLGFVSKAFFSSPFSLKR